MCGKYAAGNLTQAQLLALLEHFLYGKPLEPSHPYYYRPTQEVAIVKRQGENWSADKARWWFIPSWFKGNEVKDWKATTFNARIETAFEKPVYRDAWKKGRCLIPAIQYSEFTGNKSPKREWHIRPKSNQEWFFIAGLYSNWNGIETCTMLTRAARPEIQEIHHRQPVILTYDEIERWFKGEEIDGGLLELEFETS